MIRTHAILLIALLSGGAAHAEGPLNEQIILQFAQTWQPVTQRLVAVDPEFDPLNIPGLTSQLETMETDNGVRSERDKAVAVNGYPDFETWASEATRIIRAAQWAGNPPDAHDIDEVIAVINADTQRSQADKASAIADLKSALDTSLKLKPDTHDIALVSKFLPLLKPILAPQ